MKKSLVILAALLISLAANAQKFGYVNTQELFMQMPELKDVQARMDSLNKQYENLLMTMQEEYQKKLQDYQQKQNTLPDAMRQIQEEELYSMQQRLQTTYQTAQQDVEQKRGEYLKPINERMTKAIQEVGAANNYTYIFDAAAAVYIAQDADNVMPLVKAKLGIK
ncbi:MAG: OmpH family outer membrane protein [Paludibacteraceae bacterium]|nr:OmpH family outer membrane protein [Paludibacteraceae bacterium]